MHDETEKGTLWRPLFIFLSPPLLHAADAGGCQGEDGQAALQV